MCGAFPERQTMQHHKLALLLISAAALAGCNTWHGVKQDAREAGSTVKEAGKEVGGAVTNAVGTGLEKAGEGLNTAGEKVKGNRDTPPSTQQQPQ
jgi:predicted small secreted protein